MCVLVSASPSMHGIGVSRRRRLHAHGLPLCNLLQGRPRSVLIAQAGNQSGITHGPCRSCRDGQTRIVAGVADSAFPKLNRDSSKDASRDSPCIM